MTGDYTQGRDTSLCYPNGIPAGRLGVWVCALPAVSFSELLLYVLRVAKSRNQAWGDRIDWHDRGTAVEELGHFPLQVQARLWSVVKYPGKLCHVQDKTKETWTRSSKIPDSWHRYRVGTPRSLLLHLPVAFLLECSELTSSQLFPVSSTWKDKISHRAQAVWLVFTSYLKQSNSHPSL